MKPFALLTPAMSLFISFTVRAAALPMTPDAWFADPLAGTFKDRTFICRTSNIVARAVFERLPVCSTVHVEAVLSPERSDGRTYKTAGIGVCHDAENFWQLSLVERPDAAQGRFIELAEMRGNQWLAHRKLRLAVDRRRGSWSFGTRYTLDLTLTPDGVTGKVTGTDRKIQIFHRQFAFDGKDAVTDGRPFLKAGYIRTVFSDVHATCSGPVSTSPEKTDAAALPCPAGSCPMITGQKTGFFHLERQRDGRWWFITPNGQGLWLAGCGGVTYRGSFCEKLGYAPYERNNDIKYPSHDAWGDAALARLKSLGFNAFTGDARLAGRGLAQLEILGIGARMCLSDDELNIEPSERRPCTAFPNVFSPLFEANCRYLARLRCAPRRNDPWFLGYFLDNEFAWWGRNKGTLRNAEGLFDSVLRKPAGHSAKTALRDFLARHHDNDMAAFNAFWGTNLTSFAALSTVTALPSRTPEQTAVKRAFLRLAAERYFEIATRAVRAEDPNHLILGCRFAGFSGGDPVAWEVCGKYCDAVSVNVYPMADLDRKIVLSRFGRTGVPITEPFAAGYAAAKKPIIVTEWSFPALDSGLPCLHGAGQRFKTQAERAQASDLFIRTMMSIPGVVGSIYFKWIDQPALGVSTPFPEDSNYGLVNAQDEVYTELATVFSNRYNNVASERYTPQPLAAQTIVRTSINASAAAQGDTLSGAAPAVFSQRGTTFTLSNGVFNLKGKIGGPIRVNGEAFIFHPMLRTLRNGHARWVEAPRLISVSGGEPTNGVASAVAVFRPKDKNENFEMTLRLFLSPGAKQFIAEQVSIKNTGKSPLAAERVFFRLFPTDRVTVQATHAEQAPNLWKAPQRGVWLTGGSKPAAAGLEATADADVSIRFYRSGEGHLHPDAQTILPEGIVLQPAEIYAPAQGPWVRGWAGRRTLPAR